MEMEKSLHPLQVGLLCTDRIAAYTDRIHQRLVKFGKMLMQATAFDRNCGGLFRHWLPGQCGVLRHQLAAARLPIVPIHLLTPSDLQHPAKQNFECIGHLHHLPIGNFRLAAYHLKPGRHIGRGMGGQALTGMGLNVLFGTQAIPFQRFLGYPPFIEQRQVVIPESGNCWIGLRGRLGLRHDMSSLTVDERMKLSFNNRSRRVLDGIGLLPYLCIPSN